MAKDLQLDAQKLGLSLGIVGAVFLFCSTVLSLLGWSDSYSFFASTLFGNLGYSLSVIGAILGAIYGFVWGYVLGYVIGWLYNRIE